MLISLHSEMLAKITQLQSEVEALRKDAERYQALRRGQKWSVIDGIGDTLKAEGLDEAIDDAAIKGEQV
jgi:DNA-binding protein H-NS